MVGNIQSFRVYYQRPSVFFQPAFQSGQPFSLGRNFYTPLFFHPINQTRNLFTGPKIIDLSKLWKDPFNRFMGGVWGFLLINDLCILGLNGVWAYQNREMPAFGDLDRLKAAVIDVISSIGTFANIGDWAHREGAIDLGALAAPVQCMGYGAFCLSSGFKTYKEFLEIYSLFQQERRSADPTERLRLKKQIVLHILEMLSAGVISSWSFLGCIALITGIIFPVALMNGLICCALTVAITALFYKTLFIK